MSLAVQVLTYFPKQPITLENKIPINFSFSHSKF